MLAFTTEAGHYGAALATRGQLLLNEKITRTELRPGDLIQIGETTLRVDAMAAKAL